MAFPWRWLFRRRWSRRCVSAPPSGLRYIKAAYLYPPTGSGCNNPETISSTAPRRLNEALTRGLSLPWGAYIPTPGHGGIPYPWGLPLPLGPISTPGAFPLPLGASHYPWGASHYPWGINAKHGKTSGVTCRKHALHVCKRKQTTASNRVSSLTDHRRQELPVLQHWQEKLLDSLLLTADRLRLEGSRLEELFRHQPEARPCDLPRPISSQGAGPAILGHLLLGACGRRSLTPDVANHSPAPPVTTVTSPPWNVPLFRAAVAGDGRPRGTTATVATGESTALTGVGGSSLVNFNTNIEHFAYQTFLFNHRVHTAANSPQHKSALTAPSMGCYKALAGVLEHLAGRTPEGLTLNTNVRDGTQATTAMQGSRKSHLNQTPSFS
ncbi:hypothetical protein Bbelb_203180 [Branchiostoma belcheri]|nr:hypothetical protein Bbelb_203180 [Branchiostoma belcheri]